MFQVIRTMTREFKPKAGAVKDENGRIITTKEGVIRRWEEYTRKLYEDDLMIAPQLTTEEYEEEPEILGEEVQWAIKQIRKGKSSGIDNIPIELIKDTGDEMIKRITQLCNLIWKKKEWPLDWRRSVFIPLPKKGDTRECANNRTIALIPHMSKILLKIINKRLEPYIEKELPDEQAGFRKDRGTRDQIANLRWIMEETREFQQKIFIGFLDYSKAFDCVNHELMWKILRRMGVPAHLVELIRALYKNQEARVRTSEGETNWFGINKGVRQGCILSPKIFNMYTEYIMRVAELDTMEVGIRIGGRRINNLRYADDTTIITGSEKEMENIVMKIKEESSNAGLKLNLKKTTFMTTDERDKITIDGEDIKMEDKVNYLGVTITKLGYCTDEIKRRVVLGKIAINKLNSFVKDTGISIKTKIKLIQTMVFPIILYGCESWTMRVEEKRKVDTFEMWAWRKILNVKWTDKKTNAEILEKIKPSISLEAKATKLKLEYFGHVMRKHDSLEKDIMLGIVEGGRKQGGRRMRWHEEIVRATNLTWKEICDRVQNKKQWKRLVCEKTRRRKRQFE